jgi:hypothetical protein
MGTDPTAKEIDARLDGIVVDVPENPPTARRIVVAVDAVDSAHNELLAAVKAARDAGDSWAMIGAVLGISHQAAEQLFGQRAGRRTGRLGWVSASQPRW